MGLSDFSIFLVSELASEDVISGGFGPSRVRVVKCDIEARSAGENDGDHDNTHDGVSLRERSVRSWCE